MSSLIYFIENGCKSCPCHSEQGSPNRLSVQCGITKGTAKNYEELNKQCSMHYAEDKMIKLVLKTN